MLFRQRGRHVGLDKPECDRVDPHAQRPQLLGHRLGHPDQAGLGGRVVHLPRHPDQPGDRRDVDDRAALGLHHDERAGARDVERAGQIGLDNRGPVLLAHHHQQLVAREPGVVDHRVEPAELGLGCVDHRAHGFEVGNVGLERHRLDPECGDPGFQLFGLLFALEIIEGDVGAAARGLERDCAADPSRRPGDDYSLTLEIFHFFTFHCLHKKGRPHRRADGRNRSN